MTSVLVLSSLEQLAHVESQHSGLLAEKTTIISLDLDVSTRLQMLGYNPLSFQDFLSMDEIHAIQRASIELLNTWFLPYEPAFQVSGISPLRLERLVFAHVFRQAILAKQLMKRICETIDVDKLIFFKCQERPSNWGNITSDTFPAVWVYIAVNENLPLTLLTIDQNRSMKRSYTKALRLAKILLHALTNPLLWRVALPTRKKASYGQIFFTVAINEAFRFSKIANTLVDLLGDKIALSVSGGRSSGGVLVMNNLRFHSMSLLPTGRYLRLRRMGRSWFSHWKTIRQTETTAFPEIFQNQYLEYQFKYLFEECVPNVVQTYEEAKHIFARLGTKCLLTTSVSSLYLSGVVQAAQDLAVPVVTIPHSGIVSHVEYQTAGDYTISWTSDAARAWKRNYGLDSIVAGTPPSIISLGYRQNTEAHPHVDGIKHITLLLATAQVAYVPYVDLDRHCQTLEVILNVPDHLRDKVQVILKLHPVFDYTYFYEHLATRAEVSNIVKIIRDTALDDLLQDTDLALLVNLSTSAYLLPLSRSIPEMYVYTAHIDAQTFAFAEWGGRAVIHDLDSIWPRLEAVLFDEKAREAVLVDNGVYWDRINAGQRDPVDVIAKLLNDLAQ